MKNVKRSAAQGDVLIRRVGVVPTGATKQPPEQRVVIAHSETGHHHVASGSFDYYSQPGDALLAYMVTRGPIVIEHERTWDTHEALELLADDAGGEVVWEIRRQREWTPEGWRRVED